jgi:general secretion pathway protein F/type IV pilus assembly protein PilC
LPDFTYIARDAHGQKVQGTLAAGSQREAIALLAGRALFPLEVATDEPKKQAAGFGFGRRVKPQLIATTYGQLASLLRSGVPLLRSIAVLRDQSSHVGLKEVLQDVHDRVEEGETLADAMQRHPRVFNEMAVSMVRAGGEGAFMEEALDRVATFTEQQEDLKSRTMGALAYPVFLATIGTLVVAGLLVFFVPNFEEMFARLKERGELPVMTTWLLGFSKWLQRWGWIPLLVVVALVVWVKMQTATEAGRAVFDRMKLKLPMAGNIFLSLAVARFCRVLGTMMRNGVPILKALEISREAAGNRVLSQAILEASENVTSGQSLSKPLAASGHFPPSVVEMIAVAEESNTLDSVLTEIADGLERRTQRQLDLMVRLLEPIMLLILAGIVLLVVIALLRPVLTMSTAI